MITERDMKLLTRLYRYRFLSTRQAVAAGEFPSLQTARGRLRSLAGLKLVKFFEHPQSGERVYSITPAGCDVIGKERLHLRAPENMFFVQHMLETIDFWLALQFSEIRRRERLEIGFIPYFYGIPGRGTGKLITFRGNGGGYTPDGVAGLRRPGEITGLTGGGLLFVEIDRGTHTVEKGVGKALGHYRAYLCSGGFKRYEKVFGCEFGFFRVLVATNSERRAENILNLAGSMGDFSKFVWVCGGEYGDPLGEVWRVFGVEGRRGLVRGSGK